MRQIILDTETTGLDPKQGHRVVEIGAVEVLGRSISGRDFHVYLNPDRDSDPEALAVHGLTSDFLADKPRFADVAQEFLDFIQGAELVIHNAAFDVKFLNAELDKIGRGDIGQYCASVVDSLMTAREMRPGKRNSLDALCDVFGVANAHRTLHGALLDARLLAEVWLAMTRGQDTLLVDAPDTSANGTSNADLDRFDASVLPVWRASDEELAAHEAWLDVLDKAVKGRCVWRRETVAHAKVNQEGA